LIAVSNPWNRFPTRNFLQQLWTFLLWQPYILIHDIYAFLDINYDNSGNHVQYIERYILNWKQGGQKHLWGNYPLSKTQGYNLQILYVFGFENNFNLNSFLTLNFIAGRSCAARGRITLSVVILQLLKVLKNRSKTLLQHLDHLVTVSTNI
jgi:hypothetical protein